MFKITALTIKELKVIARDPLGLVMLFILPAVFIVVLSVALQGAFSTSSDREKIDVLVVDEDHGKVAESVERVLRDTGVFNPVTELEGRAIASESIEAAVLGGRVQVAVLIPEGADEALSLRRDAEIAVYVDPTVSTEFSFMVTSVVEDVVSMSMISGLLGEQGPYKKDKGLVVERIVLKGEGGSVEPNEVQQNVPGWTVFALFWIAQLLAINIIRERRKGTYKRILVAPVTMTEYIVGKTVPFVLINFVQAIVLFAIGVFLLPLLGCHQLVLQQPGALILTTVAISLVASGFGVFLASISSSEIFAASISAALLIIMSVIGGIMVPKFVMPSFMQTLSLTVPQGWAIECYQDILVKNHSLAAVAPKIAVLAGFAAFFFVTGLVRIHATRIR